MISKGRGGGGGQGGGMIYEIPKASSLKDNHRIGRMSRKREKPYNYSRHLPPSSSFPKRRRPCPSLSQLPDSTNPSSPATVLLLGLPPDCSVLHLKSRFEIYGCISRIRIDIDRDGLGFITFRSKDSADAAISASLDPSFGITIDSKRVQVLLSKDPNSAGGLGWNKDKGSSSKLLRAEVPLSRHGRSNKHVSSSANPKTNAIPGLDLDFKGREIVAYDDIL